MKKDTILLDVNGVLVNGPCDETVITLIDRAKAAGAVVVIWSGLPDRIPPDLRLAADHVLEKPNLLLDLHRDGSLAHVVAVDDDRLLLACLARMGCEVYPPEQIMEAFEAVTHLLEVG